MTQLLAQNTATYPDTQEAAEFGAIGAQTGIAHIFHTYEAPKYLAQTLQHPTLIIENK